MTIPTAPHSDQPADATLPADSTSPAEHLRVYRRGTGRAYGTAGDFLRGVLPDGTSIVLACPMQAVATVDIRVRTSQSLAVTTSGDSQPFDATRRTLELAADRLGLGDVEVHVRHRSMLQPGRGSGTATADALAALRALTGAADLTLSEKDQAALLAEAGVCNGTVSRKLVPVDTATGTPVRSWTWSPRFALVHVSPIDSDIDGIELRPSALPAGDLLAEFDAAVAEQDPYAFAAASTRAALAEQQRHPNPIVTELLDLAEYVGASGVVRTYGSSRGVAALLFPITEGVNGRAAAQAAAIEIARALSGRGKTGMSVTHLTF